MFSALAHMASTCCALAQVLGTLARSSVASGASLQNSELHVVKVRPG